jgi:hypothetical protein
VRRRGKEFAQIMPCVVVGDAWQRILLQLKQTSGRTTNVTTSAPHRDFGCKRQAVKLAWEPA